MIKAIIFDCFGVLTTDGWLPFKSKHFGQNSELFKQATEINRQANARLISYDQFLEEIGEMSGMSANEAGQAIDMDDGAPNEELFEYIKTLKKNYKIGMLSNTSQDMLTRLFSQAQIDLFDSITLSYEEGVTKPEKEAYLIATKKLGIEPSECVFIDDQERQIVGAHSVGMRAIRYLDFDQMKIDLEKILAAGTNN